MKKLKNVGFIIGTVLLLAACLCAVIILLVPNSSAKYAASSTATGTVSITYSNEIKCTGGTADCDSLAVCEICGNEYGSYHHSGTETWEYDEEYHWQIWSCCRIEISEKAAHSYTEGLCACGRQSHYHIYELVEETAAGCTTTGTAAHYVCTNGCDLLFDAETKAEITAASLVIEAKGHSYDSSVTKPTCTEAGYTTYTCSNCNDTYTDDEVEALGHSYGSLVVKVAATCTTDGMSAYYKCSTCETYFDSSKNATTASALVIEATGHSATTWSTNSANHYKVCKTCKEEFDSAAHDSKNSTTKAATCTATGTKTYTCSVCSYATKTETIAKLGHNYSGTVTTTATCTIAKVTQYTCSRCSDSYSETGDKDLTNHTTLETTLNKDTGALSCSGCSTTLAMPTTFYSNVKLESLASEGFNLVDGYGSNDEYGDVYHTASTTAGGYIAITGISGQYMLIKYAPLSFVTTSSNTFAIALNGSTDSGASYAGVQYYYLSSAHQNAWSTEAIVLDASYNTMYFYPTQWSLNIYIQYIAFFDTAEAAKLYQTYNTSNPIAGITTYNEGRAFKQGEWGAW